MEKRLELSTAEMPDFYNPGPFDVGRRYGGQVAHIYRGDENDCLCGRVSRRYMNTNQHIRLLPFCRTDKTCPTCIRKYRKLKAQHA